LGGSRLRRDADRLALGEGAGGRSLQGRVRARPAARYLRTRGAGRDPAAGNAGANNAADHLQALELALDQLPRPALDGPILARADSAGASHDFAFACRETDIRDSLGYAIRPPVREQILALPESAWRPALNADGEPREGAWVAELTGRVNLDSWPEGTRLICRRERPHPGAALSFTDLDGHRFQCFITDQPDQDIA
jgi:hypothetical protein